MGSMSADNERKCAIIGDAIVSALEGIGLSAKSEALDVGHQVGVMIYHGDGSRAGRIALPSVTDDDGVSRVLPGWRDER